MLNFSDVFWVVESKALDENAVNGTVQDALLYLGIDHKIIEYIPFSDNVEHVEGLPNIPVIVYGSINYVSRLKTPYFPGAYGWNNMNCNEYYSHIPNDWLLNGSYVMIPFYKVKDTLKLLGWKDAFIRPNSGRKAFTGFTITEDNVDQEMKSTLSLTGTYPETICLMSPAVNIRGEFRFVIGNNNVIDGSEYRWDRRLDIRHDWDPDAYDLAGKMAGLGWQPDTVYVVDVAITDIGPKIVELNSFCSAGLYAMDKLKVVASVSDIAYKEFRGEL